MLIDSGHAAYGGLDTVAWYGKRFVATDSAVPLLCVDNGKFLYFLLYQ